MSVRLTSKEFSKRAADLVQSQKLARPVTFVILLGSIPMQGYKFGLGYDFNKLYPLLKGARANDLAWKGRPGEDVHRAALRAATHPFRYETEHRIRSYGWQLDLDTIMREAEGFMKSAILKMRHQDKQKMVVRFLLGRDILGHHYTKTRWSFKSFQDRLDWEGKMNERLDAIRKDVKNLKKKMAAEKVGSKSFELDAVMVCADQARADLIRATFRSRNGEADVFEWDLATDEERKLMGQGHP